MTFKDWLVGNLGPESDFQYQAIHIITTIVVVLVTILFAFLGANKKISDKSKKSILISISVFQLVFEVLWRLIFLFVKKTDAINLWPMYPCNVGGILIPLFAILNLNKGKQMFYLFGFVGGILTFAMPEGIFVYDVMVFPILKSVLQHTGLLIIPVFEYASKTFKPSTRYYLWVILGCLIHLFNCEVIDRWFGFEGDYMFFRSGLPFVIPGIPQYITFSIFGATVLYLLSFLCDIKDSLLFNKSILKKHL